MALTFDSHYPGAAHEPGQMVALFVRMAAIASVLGGLTFNFFLCLVNTRVMPIAESHVILMELAVTGTAFLAALDRRAGLYLFLAIFLSYMVFLFALRGQNDIKAIRDIINPVIFFALGSRIRDLKFADSLALAAAIITLVFAFFEYFLLELYLDWFNVLGYYISRGTVTLEQSYGATKGLFISGSRPEPRTLLPFLGQQRVSSVFLEPVSMGNFGAIIYAWGLFRRDMNRRYLLMGIALALVVLADARFGLATCILVTVLGPFFRLVARPIWFVMPLILLAGFAAYGMIMGTGGTGPNDVAGRFAITAGLLNSLSLGNVIGYEAAEGFTADSGFAYTLSKFGIFGFIGLWAAQVFIPLRDARAWQFQSMMLAYLLLIMIISNSFYSVKTAALMWFLLGTAAAARLPDVPSFWQRLLRRAREAQARREAPAH
jgi:putative polymerase